jgi:hypothetical protein
MTFEPIHILAGPTVGVFLTILAFADEQRIRQVIARYLTRRRVQDDLADRVAVLTTASSFLGTFLGNIYLASINSIIGIIVFPIKYYPLTISISEIVILSLAIRTVHLFTEYDVLDIFEIEIRPAPGIVRTYDQILRIEQVSLNIITFIYFAIGIYLN